jgi:hypothetical protein
VEAVQARAALDVGRAIDARVLPRDERTCGYRDHGGCRHHEATADRVTSIS